MRLDRRYLAVKVEIENVHHGLGRQPVRQRREAAQVRQPDRRMHRIGVAAADLAAHDPLAGAVTDIEVEQVRSGTAHAGDFDDPGQRRDQRPQSVELLIGEAARLPGGPARRVNRAVDLLKRQRDIVGDTLGAQVVEEREALAVGTVDQRSDFPPLIEHDRERTVSVFRRIQHVVSSRCRRPPRPPAAR